MSRTSQLPRPADGRPGERGSAMVLAILVTVIMTLLGVSFLMMAQTENRIAENEKRRARRREENDATD